MKVKKIELLAKISKSHHLQLNVKTKLLQKLDSFSQKEIEDFLIKFDEIETFEKNLKQEFLEKKSIIYKKQLEEIDKN